MHSSVARHAYYYPARVQEQFHHYLVYQSGTLLRPPKSSYASPVAIRQETKARGDIDSVDESTLRLTMAK